MSSFWPNFWLVFSTVSAVLLLEVLGLIAISIWLDSKEDPESEIEEQIESSKLRTIELLEETVAVQADTIAFMRETIKAKDRLISMKETAIEMLSGALASAHVPLGDLEHNTQRITDDICDS